MNARAVRFFRYFKDCRIRSVGGIRRYGFQLFVARNGVPFRATVIRQIIQRSIRLRRRVGNDRRTREVYATVLVTGDRVVIALYLVAYAVLFRRVVILRILARARAYAVEPLP